MGETKNKEETGEKEDEDDDENDAEKTKLKKTPHEKLHSNNG